ncbi:zinc ribbon domain-containing protein [Rubripirellula amarantea]|nr:zinc ribbon domain-containing protein [Rubripirellula amarantea]
MTIKHASSPAVVCAPCQATNSPEAKFCKGCGHSLYEACVKCNASVLLDQKFCNACGADLNAMIANKIKQHEEKLASAVEAAKRSDFDYALDVLEPISVLEDFRFKDIAAIAKKALDQITTLRKRSTSHAEQMKALASEALQNDNREEVVKYLSNVPEPLLDHEFQVMLAESKNFVQELRVLKTELTQSSQKGDWLSCGGLIDQLLSLCPQNQKYAKTAETVAAKLLSKAKKYYSVQRYADSAKHLEAIPKQHINDEARKLTETINDVRWLFETIEAEPYMTPALGQMAAKLAQLVPDDARSKKLLSLLREKKQQPSPEARCQFSSSLGGTSAWTGGEVKVLSRPIQFEADDQVFKSNEGILAVAIGLCVQGLGKARITDELSGSKKGFFGRRKTNSCWGIDIGSSSFKAVRMELAGDSMRITDSFVRNVSSARLLQPSKDRTEEDENSALRGALESTIKEFTETFDLTKETLWGNLPSSEMTTRFVRLPPLHDKKALPLMDAEIANRIPLPLDDLVVTRTLSPFDKESLHGRAAIFSAARKMRAQRRMQLLEGLGLKLDGLQADANAIVNFAYYEFADFFTPDNTSEPATDTSVARFEEETPTICIVDAGADTTTIIFVSSETHWFWSIDSGGERLSSALARSTKSTTTQAEQLKRDPAKLTSPESQFSPVEERMDQLRVRLQQLKKDAIAQNSRFKCVQTWCLGGNAQTYQWIRRVLVTRSDETPQKKKKPTDEELFGI